LIRILIRDPESFDPGFGMENFGSGSRDGKTRIRDGKIRIRNVKKSDPGSEINIPDSQHCYKVVFFTEKMT
jgi:hypothetical protein